MYARVHKGPSIYSPMRLPYTEQLQVRDFN
jgi:hypothetical protein